MRVAFHAGCVAADYWSQLTAHTRADTPRSELLSVPADLRVCLETCLSDQPSQTTLERHLPQVRQIIIGLLHGLREKQRLYREGVAARRQRDARAIAAGSVVQQQQQQQQTNATNLTPSGANRSRDELRRFVTQAQQGTGPTASTSSSSVGANEPASRSRGGGAGETLGAPTRRSTSDQGLPSSSFASGTSGEVRSSTVLSSRSGSLRESMRSSTHPQPRPVPEDVRGPPSGPSTTVNRLTRSVSSASLDTPPVAAPAQVGSPERPALERSATASGKILMSPPPPPRRRNEDVPAVPQTPTLDTFGPVMTAASISASSSSTTTAVPPAAPNRFARHPSAGSIRSLTDEHAPPHVQAASLEALRADNLSRRASKRYSAYAIQKMTSPNASSGGSGPSPSSSSSNGFGHTSTPGGSGGVGGGVGDEWHVRGGKAGASSSAGRELAGVDAPRRSKSEYHVPTGAGSSSRQNGHRPTASASYRRDAVPPLPPIPRTYTAAGGGAVGTASPILQEEHERSLDSIGSPESSSGPPLFPPPRLPSSSGVAAVGGDSTNEPVTPQRSNSSSSLSRTGAHTPRAGSPSIALQQLPQIAPSGLAGSIASFSTSEPEYPCFVFLQIGRNVKKARLSAPPELASLRQLFVERFGYNPGLAEWPDIYLRDADSGVHYELEDMNEIRAGSVLSLNVDSEYTERMSRRAQVRWVTLTRPTNCSRRASQDAHRPWPRVPDPGNQGASRDRLGYTRARCVGVRLAFAFAA